MSDLRFRVLGTAGHIDHGKTSLVRLLTGTDTDRLKEEKARGISIDLGFAHLDLPGGLSLGIVDVPGHERFVKNMLAGAGGVDAVMLVIAADEGVMPQTREHLDIMDLLGVRRGLVALTKTDMVEPDWLDLVTETVREYLASRGFGHFPLVPVSAKTGEGRETLLETLAEVMTDLEDRPEDAAVRLPIDRAFVVEGFGTVVTGTLWRGVIHPGDRLVIQPGNIETRVRNVEVHGENAPRARAGQRTAAALPGVSRDQVPRGTWLVAGGTLEPSHMLSVRLRVLKEAPRPVAHRQRIRFHLGATEVLGRVVMLEHETLEPGRDGLVQLRLEAPVVADRGDRFVLRTYSPARALAGGTVIVPRAEKLRRKDREAVERLRLEETGTPADRMLAVVEGHSLGVDAATLAREAGLTPDSLREILAELTRGGAVVNASGTEFIARRALRKLEARALEILEETQRAQPLRWGVSRGEFKSRLGKQLSPAVFEALLEGLLGDGRVAVREDHVRLGGGEQILAPEAEARVAAVLGALEAGGVGPPTLRELETRLGGGVQEALEYLTFHGSVAKVTPDLFLTRDGLARIQAWVRSHFDHSPELAMADLKSGLGMSRKYSVPIMEYLDKLGFTRRSGDVRIPGKRLNDSH